MNETLQQHIRGNDPLGTGYTSLVYSTEPTSVTKVVTVDRVSEAQARSLLETVEPGTSEWLDLLDEARKKPETYIPIAVREYEAATVLKSQGFANMATFNGMGLLAHPNEGYAIYIQKEKLMGESAETKLARSYKSNIEAAKCGSDAAKSAYLIEVIRYLAATAEYADTLAASGYVDIDQSLANAIYTLNPRTDRFSYMFYDFTGAYPLFNYREGIYRDENSAKNRLIGTEYLDKNYIRSVFSNVAIANSNSDNATSANEISLLASQIHLLQLQSLFASLVSGRFRGVGTRTFERPELIPAALNYFTNNFQLSTNEQAAAGLKKSLNQILIKYRPGSRPMQKFVAQLVTTLGLEARLL